MASGARRFRLRSPTAVAIAGAIPIGLLSVVMCVLMSLGNPNRNQEDMLLVIGVFGLAPVFGALGYWYAVGVYLQPHPSTATAFFAGLISPIGIVVFSGGFGLLFVFYSFGFVLVPGVISGAIVGCLFGASPEPDFCACGYNLTGNVSGRCPECGTIVSPTDATNKGLLKDVAEPGRETDQSRNGPPWDLR